MANQTTTPKKEKLENAPSKKQGKDSGKGCSNNKPQPKKQ